MLKSIIIATLFAFTSAMKLKELKTRELNGEMVTRAKTCGETIKIPDKSFRIPMEVVSSGRQISVKLENLEDVEPQIVTECAFLLKARINDAQVRTIHEESQDKEHSKLHHLAQTLAKSGGVEHLKDMVKHCSMEDGRQKRAIELFADIDGFDIPNYSVCFMPFPSGDQVKDLTAQGDQYFRMGDNVKALESLQASLALDNEQADVHSTVASIYKKNGDGERMLHHYQEAVRIEQDNAMWRYNLGVSLSICKTPDGGSFTDAAIVHLRKAVELREGYTTALAELALILSEDKGEHDEALPLMNKAIVARPRDTGCTFGMKKLLQWRKEIQARRGTAGE